MNSVGISIGFIRELTLSGHFCWLARGFRSLFSGQTPFFFHGVEGRACVVGGSLKLVFDYGVPRKEQSFRNQTSEIWIFWNSCFFGEWKNWTCSKFQNLGWEPLYYISTTLTFLLCLFCDVNFIYFCLGVLFWKTILMSYIIISYVWKYKFLKTSN